MVGEYPAQTTCTACDNVDAVLAKRWLSACDRWRYCRQVPDVSLIRPVRNFQRLVCGEKFSKYDGGDFCLQWAIYGYRPALKIWVFSAESAREAAYARMLRLDASFVTAKKIKEV